MTRTRIEGEGAGSVESQWMTLEQVNIAGLDDEISIGRLTREVEKTETKNVFSWRDKRFRLVYDGRVRDR